MLDQFANGSGFGLGVFVAAAFVFAVCSLIHELITGAGRKEPETVTRGRNERSIDGVVRIADALQQKETDG